MSVTFIAFVEASISVDIWRGNANSTAFKHNEIQIEKRSGFEVTHFCGRNILSYANCLIQI